MEDILKNILEQEHELQFTCFNESTAWQLGTQMVDRAMRENLPVTIDITRGQQQLFHYSMPGT
ncbi:MAG TPA: heme-binding protein, partial [Anaerolineales bacterium]|nr:heme-binding protein [Anaerolineales bacterium]